MTTCKYALQWAVALLLGLATCVCADDDTATTPPRRQGEMAQPLVRDVWYAYEDGDLRYGFEHVTVEKREDGNFAYRLESKLLLDLSGQRQELTQNSTFIVTPALEPVSLEEEGKQQSGATRTTGHVEGSELVVVYQREGLRRERRIDLSRKPLLAACLDDWLRSNGSAAEPLRRQIVDDSSLELNDGIFSRKDAEGAGSVWDVDLGPGGGRSTIVLGPDGVRTEATFQFSKMHLRRVSEAEAKEIKHRTYPERELLEFPVDRPVGPVQRLTALTVRLRWAGAGAEQLRLEDERQKEVQRSTRDGETQILVRIQPVDERDTPPAPVEAGKLQPYLGEDRYIKPHDPKVADQARVWMGDADSKTPLAVVRAMSRGIFTYMQGGSLIVETLSAPEILECKQGKCSEFAILFASAARSAGIPTRIVLGMRMVSGSWMGHMWNEAFVGRWITVDSTTDEVGSAPGLLKLVDSDSVDGTQSVRWAATEALQVAIEDSEPSPPNDAEGKTGIDGSVYTNAEFACRLTAPQADWLIENSPQKGAPATVIRFQVPDHDDVLIHFVLIDVPAAFTPQMLTAARLARFKGTYKEFEVLKDEDYAVQKMKGRLLTFGRRGAGTEGTKMKTTEVLWSDGTSSFLLNLIANEKAHDDYAADFFKLLGSFESLRPSADDRD
jgi:hypothetical protein